MLPLCLALLTQSPDVSIRLARTPRFELAAPLPAIPAVTVDSYLDGIGLAQPTARNRGLQARVMWIDGTANIVRYNTEAKIVSLVHRIKTAGFNTIVFDIKPISGQVIYNSEIAPKLASWRGVDLPAEFDPLVYMCRETKKEGLSLLVSLNAFSEGHQMFKVGPGYGHPERQTVMYEAENVIVAPDDSSISVVKGGGKTAGSAVEVWTRKPDPSAAFVVVLDRFGGVSSRGEATAENLAKWTLPSNGSVLTGSGTAADFLNHKIFLGTKVRFDTKPNFVPFGQSHATQYPLMMNPNDPVERDYELSIAHEVISKYAVDGMMYDDRLRYAGIDADFSEVTRAKFEEAMGAKLTWPDDVFKFTIGQDLTRGIRPGRYYDQWIAWRATVVRDYLKEVRHTIEAVRPGVRLGMYAGSWYGEYPALGNNYASPQANAGFWFMTPNYKKAADAPIVDFIIPGCYYTTATIFDAMSKGVGIGNSVEAAGRMVNRLVRDQAWTYAGISLIDFAGNPQGLSNALQAACASTEGVMVFDLSHNIEPMWPVFEHAFAQPMKAPHMHPEILADVRKRRAKLDTYGLVDPPIVIANGSSGIGQ